MLFLAVLGLLAIVALFPQHPTTSTPAPAAVVPRVRLFDAPIVLSFADVNALRETPNEPRALSSSPGVSIQRRKSDGAVILVRSPQTDAERAEAHNLQQMRSYQERVIRALDSPAPVFPSTPGPTFEERLSEGVRAEPIGR